MLIDQVYLFACLSRYIEPMITMLMDQMYLFTCLSRYLESMITVNIVGVTGTMYDFARTIYVHLFFPSVSPSLFPQVTIECGFAQLLIDIVMSLTEPIAQLVL